MTAPNRGQGEPPVIVPPRPAAPRQASSMRDECIALEAVKITTSTLAHGDRATSGEIAAAAIAVVDEAAAKGDLGLLHASWTVDWDEVRGT